MEDWCVKASQHSKETINPIRLTVEKLVVPEDFPRKSYSLLLSDPAAFEDFKVDEVVTSAISSNLLSRTGNGYTDSLGPYASREALASYYSYDNIQVTAEDVMIDISGIGAIHTVMQCLLNRGDNYLLPSPGFPLYKTVGGNLGLEPRLYRLIPDQNWEIDLQQIDKLTDARTKLMVIINPSNPCGNVFTKSHLLEILAWAERRKICILSDELYHNLTFGVPHWPIGSLTDKVPIFAVGALSKMFLMPGARCGWTVIYDKYNRCRGVRKAMVNIRNMLMHPVPFIANAIPEILRNIPPDYFSNVTAKVKSRAELVFAEVENIPTLKMSMPAGGFQCIISIDCTQLQGVESSLQFSELLVKEEGVAVLPAEVLFSENAFRIALCCPENILRECFARIRDFINRHLIN